MAKLKRLKINKFRNVEPVELHFSDGFNVLLGINGSGKTTFLELIAAILKRDISSLGEEELNIEYELDFDGGSIELKLALHADEAQHEGRRRVRERSEGGHALNIDVRLHGTSESGDRAETSWQKVPEGSFVDFEWVGWDTSDKLYGISRFGESVDFFESLGSDAELIQTFAGPYVEEDTLCPLVFSGRPVSPALMTWLTRESMGQWPTWREPQSFRVSMTELPFLAKMVQLAGFKNGWLEFRLLHTSQASGYKDMTFGRLEFWFERQDGSRVHSDKLSHGQKRLLAFLYYLDCNPHIVIADELTNGLHHAWITACLEAIGDRQAFLANQDPLLVDNLEFSSLEDVKRAFILCRCDTSSGKERLVWSHMSDDDAERFFEAYEVGLQHVSEILRTKNLW